MNKYNLKINKNLKGIITVASFAFLLAGTSSCSEERLDQQPYNQVAEETIFTSQALVEQAVNGMYNAAQRGDYAGAGRGYPFGAAYQIQNDMRGEDMVSTATFFQNTYISAINGAAALNNIYYWLDTYRLINRANLLIEGIDKAVTSGKVTKADTDKFKGQALFFRAISHFEMLKHFSKPIQVTGSELYEYGVPYMLKGSTNLQDAIENAKVDRETVAKTYVKVLADLDAAEGLLANKSSVFTISKEAAIAYKTIVKLHKRDWPGVIAEANKLDGKFSLETDPNNPWANNAGNSESIFSIENSETNNPTTNGALPAMHAARNLIAISPVIWNNSSWLATDKRRSSNLVLTPPKSKDPLKPTPIQDRKYSLKYKDITNRSDAAPIIRYAEVLLNRAEAKARLGDATYLTDLNRVRDRSLDKPATEAYTDGSFTTITARVKAILIEKRIEFIAEGKRWGDIHRLINDDLAPTSGIPQKHKNGVPKASDYNIGTPYVFASGDVAAIPYTDFRFLWPIPDSQVNVNATLKAQQNKGW